MRQFSIHCDHFTQQVQVNWSACNGALYFQSLQILAIFVDFLRNKWQN